LYLARGGAAGQYESTILVGALGSSARVKVLSVASNVAYASGHLLFVREGALMAQAFDVRRLRVTGTAEVVAEDARWDERFSLGDFAASQNGLLALLTGKEEQRAELRWVSRDGSLSGPIGQPAEYFGGGSPHISPDGRHATVGIDDPERGTLDVWMVDLGDGSRRRLTMDDQSHDECIWSPDGTELAEAFGGGKVVAGIEVTSPMGVGAAKIAWTAPNGQEPIALSSWSPDGRYLLFSYRGDNWALPMAGGREPLALHLASLAGGVEVSPDGRFVCFNSSDSGRLEVYVATFPRAGGKWQVSSGGGYQPHWSRDGKELFYVDSSFHLIAVEVRTTGSVFEAGAARALFQRYFQGTYDVSPDGKRFLMAIHVQSANAPAPITVVTNWPTLLKKRR
jgi:hypothetical protein